MNGMPRALADGNPEGGRYQRLGEANHGDLEPGWERACRKVSKVLFGVVVIAVIMGCVVVL